MAQDNLFPCRQKMSAEAVCFLVCFLFVLNTSLLSSHIKNMLHATRHQSISPSHCHHTSIKKWPLKMWHCRVAAGIVTGESLAPALKGGKPENARSRAAGAGAGPSVVLTDSAACNRVQNYTW